MAPKQAFVVKLSVAQRETLTHLIRTGVGAARKLQHARILLKADRRGEAWADPAIAKALDVSLATVQRVRKRFALRGLQVALEPKPQPPRPQKKCLDGAGEARLVALACSSPPEGHDHWTLDLLAGQMVQLHQAKALSRETVRRTLKKTRSSRG